MRKRLISVSLALLFCLALLPMSVFADDLELDFSTPPEISKLEICQEGSSTWIQLRLITPSSVRDVIDLLEFFNRSDYIKGIQINFSLDGGAWQILDMSFEGTGSRWNGVWKSEPVPGLTTGSHVVVKARYYGTDISGADVLSDWSNTLELQGSGGGSNEEPSEQPFEFIADNWAKSELAEADAAGVIPEALRALDLTQPITRAEFAAVSVKVYEALSGQKAEPVAVNPFTDTNDPEVLKAYNVGITNGFSDTEFAPDKLLTREQAATMLTRVFKKVSFSGWTLAADGDFAEQLRALFTMPDLFADDGDISAYARDSVYFMASKGIIKGIEGGKFAPRAVTEEQQAEGYARCKREEALLIAIRMVKNLKQN